MRTSPEYLEIQRQNRNLARQAGDAKKAAEEARAEAERVKQAAEAERAAAQESQVRAVLGDEGVARWNELAELSSSDPVAAAAKFAEFMRQAQTPPAGTPSVPVTPAGGEPPVTPPAAPRRVDASGPLIPGTAAPDDSAYLASLDKRFSDTSARVQDPTTRNRVTMKERGSAMIGYLEAAYRRAMGGGEG